MTATCDACRHFHAAANIDLSAHAAQGECRRYPPTRSDIATPQGLAQLSGFPTTKRGFGCGEWTPRLKVVA